MQFQLRDMEHMMDPSSRWQLQSVSNFSTFIQHLDKDHSTYIVDNVFISMIPWIPVDKVEA